MGVRFGRSNQKCCEQMVHPHTHVGHECRLLADTFIFLGDVITGWGHLVGKKPLVALMQSWDSYGWVLEKERAACSTMRLTACRRGRVGRKMNHDMSACVYPQDVATQIRQCHNATTESQHKASATHPVPPETVLGKANMSNLGPPVAR